MYVHAHVTSGYFSDFESATASCSYEFMTSLWLPWPQGWGHPSSGHGHCTELLLRVPDLGRAIRRQFSPREVESCDLANWNTSEHIGSAKYCEWIRDTLRLETVDWNGHFQCFGWIWMPPDHPRSLVRPSQTCAVLASWFRLRQMMNASISTYHAYAGATVLVWHQWVSCILLHAWMNMDSPSSAGARICGRVVSASRAQSTSKPFSNGHCLSSVKFSIGIQEVGPNHVDPQERPSTLWFAILVRSLLFGEGQVLNLWERMLTVGFCWV